MILKKLKLWWRKWGFDPQYYLERYAEVREAKLDPWFHYVNYGRKNGYYRSAAAEKKGRSCSKWVNGADMAVISDSSLFDSEWYCREYKLASTAPRRAAEDYIQNWKAGNRNPSEKFSNEEYLLLNPDVAQINVCPLLHYERYGKKEKRPFRLEHLKDFEFPEGTEEINECFTVRQSTGKKRVGVFASFSKNGRISRNDISLLSGLREICDYIIYVADSPLFRDEINRLREYCECCICTRHQEYDFGSYKLGIRYLRDNNIVNEADTLVILNNSCYGPIYPFSLVAKRMESAGVDFYGLSTSHFPEKHIQSFMYFFNHRVFASSEFNSFFESVKKELTPSHVIMNYEVKLTGVLERAGFTYETFIQKDWACEIGRSPVPTDSSVELIQNYSYPLAKVKMIKGAVGADAEKLKSIIEKVNPYLYAVILEDLKS